MNLESNQNRGKYSPKLSSEEKLEVLRLLSEFKTPAEISKIIKEQFGKDIVPNSIRFYLENEDYRFAVDKMRRQFLNSYLEIPISHKRIRLERLEELFREAAASKKVHQALQALSQAQDELEGKGSTIQNNFQFNKYAHLSNSELEKVIDESYEKWGRLKEAKKLQAQQGKVIDGSLSETPKQIGLD